MENTLLLKEIQNKFNFLINKYNFILKKNEVHWLGGAVVEYEKDNIVFSILYDRRESWFYCKLFTKANLDKPPLFFHTELKKLCKIPDPVISIDNDEAIINYLDTIGLCLDKNAEQVLHKFELGDYWKQ